jgi:hypothetical protein
MYLILRVEGQRLAKFMKRQYEVMESARRMWRQDRDTKKGLREAWRQFEEKGKCHTRANQTWGDVEGVRKVTHEPQIDIDFNEGGIKDRLRATFKITMQAREVAAWQHPIRESIRQATWDNVKRKSAEVVKEGIDRETRRQKEN